MEIDEKFGALQVELPKLFPGLETEILRMGTLRELFVTQVLQIYITHKNKNLINSPYYYKKKQLVHFTNALALDSMLMGKSIRLYNLYNLNDPREFTFASKVLRLNEPLIQDAKTKIFLISFCEPEILRNSTYEFNMWRLYGQNGRGLAIVFSIFNNPIEWMDFHISKVFYGSDQRNVFNNVQRLIDRLNKDLPEVRIDLGKLLPFHKSKLFSLEKEVRIISDRRGKISGSTSQLWHDHNIDSFPKIRSDMQKLAEYKNNTQYLTIPIFHQDINVTNPQIPLLKIERIIIGYNYLDDELPNLINCLTELCKENIGYVPEIKCTRLRNYYLDLKKKQ